MTLISRGLFLALALAVSLPAQETRGRVQGSVRDPSGAVVAGANVLLSNDNTGVNAVASTNETGRYIFDMVIPGHDAEVTRRYPASKPGLEGICVRLD